MTDTADAEQARVFITMLHAEIAVISARIERAERMARTAWEVGRTSSRRWYVDDARMQRAILYELHRQLDSLHTGFPGARVSEPPLTHRDRTP